MLNLLFCISIFILIFANVANKSKMHPLECAVQNYAWGKLGRESFIARLLPAESVDERKHYAEFWMGTHPNGPSRLMDKNDQSGTLLKDFLAQNPTMLGPHERGELNFLFKVLSVGNALSVQSHPTKEQAKVLHAKDPKNYPDDNHKPEMAIALTDFELLCGFQKPHGIISSVKAHRELLELIGEPQLDGLAGGTKAEAKEALRSIFTQVWNSPAEKIAHVIEEIVARLRKKTDRAPVDDLVLRLNEQFPGGDIGVLAPFFMNHFTLRAGQATFLGPNEPHAYLSGDCVECMALSDNTIRAGLTPKFKDVQTLCSSLTYEMYDPPIFVPRELPSGVLEYAPPVEEFAVHKIDGSVSSLVSIEAASILIVVAGSSTIGSRLGSVGDVLFIEKSKRLELVGPTADFLAFRAFTSPK